MSLVSNNNPAKLADVNKNTLKAADVEHRHHADCQEDHDVYCKTLENHHSCPVEFSWLKAVVDGFSSALDYLISDGPKTLSGFALSLQGLDVDSLAKNSDAKTKEALTAFISGVQKLSECPKTSNIDITEAIQRWSGERDADSVLLVLQAIRSGDCSVLNKNPQLKEKLLADLPRLLEIFKDIKRNGGSDEAIEAAAQVVDEHLEIVDALADENKAHENGLVDESGILTDDGKEMVTEKLNTAVEKGEKLLENHSEYISKPMQQFLRSWIQSTIDFINEYYEELEVEAEKRKEEEKCEERHDAIKHFYDRRASMKKAQEKKLNLRAEVATLRSKFTALLDTIKSLGIPRGSTQEMELGAEIYAKNARARNEAEKEANNSAAKCEIICEMPSETHCEEGSMNINFDLTC